MKFTHDDKEVVKAFMNQQSMKSYRCKSDGQSFFSGDLRVAEHIPDGNGMGATIVYCGLATLLICFVVDKVFGFRASADDEKAGLDHSQHGEHGYGLLNLN